MGTTLTALVELRSPLGRWRRVAVWSLDKDYELMATLRLQAMPDWPHDAHDRDQPENDFSRYWMDGNTVVDDVPHPSPAWRALCASMIPLVRAGQARVLYIER